MINNKGKTGKFILKSMEHGEKKFKLKANKIHDGLFFYWMA